MWILQVYMHVQNVIFFQIHWFIHLNMRYMEWPMMLWQLSLLCTKILKFEQKNFFATTNADQMKFAIYKSILIYLKWKKITNVFLINATIVCIHKLKINIMKNIFFVLDLYNFCCKQTNWSKTNPYYCSNTSIMQLYN